MSSRLMGVALTIFLALAGVNALHVRADSTTNPGGDPGKTGTGSATATAGDGSVTATAANQQTNPGGGIGPTNSGTSPCTSQPLPDGGAQLNEEWQLFHASPTFANNFSAYGVTPGVDPSTGRWYLLFCPPAGAMPVWVAPGGPAPTANPLALAQRALSTIHLPAPVMEMAPAASRGVVNLLAYLWIDREIWTPVAATAAAGPVSATATVTPDKVVWSMGNGDQLTCTGPGVPYDLSIPREQQHTDCGYVYARDSHSQPGGTYTVTARVYWHVTWTAAGAPGGGDLGDIAGAAASSQATVDEIQAIVTG